jgi:hypothetical protein
MRSYVFVFVPCEVYRETEAPVREHVEPERKNIDEAAIEKPETIDDAEQLPLWRWFTF